MAKKVMLVDDDADLLDELADTLRTGGYEVVTVEDASAALETALSVRPDVIVLDIRMGRKSGFEVAEDIRKTQGLSNIPIIGMTGFLTRRHDRFLINSRGIDEYLTKPFNPLDIIAKIEFMAP